MVWSAALRLLAAAVLLWTRDSAPWPWLHRLMLALALAGLATIPCSLVVLRQRLREIDGGELDEARKY